ncbi:hypothetical protein GGTG_05601 [Gaeumannomyces tritici R3-111a-1]|uniref:Uncharacterized protein n=1 Tax=Gaeumannomyces tritici (strain R3-111a-1) TaxID=644352 RepID=J3NWD7_GAET3|nr:hypothetical protein GGTG_05601 [Gaeumannomyces tritici R3-111a-1]EJT75669.1 hypothetical protein GGTG_05601 [Gaeumannomyces tritici R3-111a-1]
MATPEQQNPHNSVPRTLESLVFACVSDFVGAGIGEAVARRGRVFARLASPYQDVQLTAVGVVDASMASVEEQFQSNTEQS